MLFIEMVLHGLLGNNNITATLITVIETSLLQAREIRDWLDYIPGCSIEQALPFAN